VFTVVAALAQWPGVALSSAVHALPGVGVLPPLNGSPPPPTDAWFVAVALVPLGTADASTFTGRFAIVLVPVVATSTALFVHVTAWPVKLQLQPLNVVGLVQFAVIPVGSVSSTVTGPTVAAPPVFVTVSEYVAPVWPTVHGPFEVFVTCTFGATIDVVTVHAEHVVSALLVTVLPVVPAVAGVFTFTVNVLLALPFAATVCVVVHVLGFVVVPDTQPVHTVGPASLSGPLYFVCTGTVSVSVVVPAVPPLFVLVIV
jgi:hypothetical protein